MKVASEYSAINTRHDDLNGVQQEQQHDDANVAVFDGEKLFCRAWMLLLTMGMVLLSLKTPGYTNALGSEVNTKALGSDVLVNNALRSTKVECYTQTSNENGVAACRQGFFVQGASVNLHSRAVLTLECCPQYPHILTAGDDDDD